MDKKQFLDDLKGAGRGMLLDAFLNLPMEDGLREDLAKAQDGRARAHYFSLLYYIYMRRQKRLLRLAA